MLEARIFVVPARKLPNSTSASVNPKFPILDGMTGQTPTRDAIDIVSTLISNIACCSCTLDVYPTTHGVATLAIGACIGLPA